MHTRPHVINKMTPDLRWRRTCINIARTHTRIHQSMCAFTHTHTLTCRLTSNMSTNRALTLRMCAVDTNRPHDGVGHACFSEFFLSFQLCVFMRPCVFVYLRACIYAHVHVCMHMNWVHRPSWSLLCAAWIIYIYIYIYIYTHIHTYIHTYMNTR